MRRRVTIFVIAALLALYALAGLHQFLPHHDGHGAGDNCALCMLLAAPSLIAAGPTLRGSLVHGIAPAAAHTQVTAAVPRGVLLLRGPPLPEYVSNTSPIFQDAAAI